MKNERKRTKNVNLGGDSAFHVKHVCMVAPQAFGHIAS